MEQTLNYLKSIPDSVIFSFGGIGSTPDDHTRDVASRVFSSGEMEYQAEFLNIIKSRFGDDRFELRKKMAYLPVGAELLYQNPINKMCGFYIKERAFFVPGFPEMAHSMIQEALDRFFGRNSTKTYKKAVEIDAPEGYLIPFMESLPEEIKLSSLPKTNIDSSGSINPSVDIELQSLDEVSLQLHFKKLIELSEKEDYSYRLI
jgi:molybdopterin-biosynthesis enzyme MoeA-like protein